uniref:Uncharacterized protein n=1 Tax=Anguilla anguilla TaxID=7936 RepID=A0A0E9QND5_ANGAN
MSLKKQHICNKACCMHRLSETPLKPCPGLTSHPESQTLPWS